jgi:hypothetical protein
MHGTARLLEDGGLMAAGQEERWPLQWAAMIP